MNRIIRGSSWYYTSHNARVALRDWYTPDSRFNLLGLRLVRRING
jgi:formylglycine-generating enzyme required for sulfatase activity